MPQSASAKKLSSKGTQRAGGAHRKVGGKRAPGAQRKNERARRGKGPSLRGRTAARSRKRPSRRRRFDWVHLSDEELLDVRICDLGLRLHGTALEQRIQKLHAELAQKGIKFRPHCWLSEEWFSPDGVPGFAIPFFLAHPRLVQLEHRQMLEVEGGTSDWCMRILRHETGHAIDNAFGLHRRRSWSRLFGPYSQPYPEVYQPKPYSRSYVLHLEPWYAQSHPSEDFAETFAVWLKPRSAWRNQYAGWPALKKLEYVDRVMGEIGSERPKVRSRNTVEPVHKIRKTLREHYRERRDRYAIDRPSALDRELCRLFSQSPRHGRRRTAAGYLRAHRTELRRIVSRWTGQYQYIIDLVLKEMINRCRALKLRMGRSEAQVQRDVLVMLTVQTMNYLKRGRHRFVL